MRTIVSVKGIQLASNPHQGLMRYEFDDGSTRWEETIIPAPGRIQTRLTDKRHDGEWDYELDRAHLEDFVKHCGGQFAKHCK